MAHASVAGVPRVLEVKTAAWKMKTVDYIMQPRQRESNTIWEEWLPQVVMTEHSEWGPQVMYSR
jgi:hypothetical protein